VTEARTPNKDEMIKTRMANFGCPS